MNTGSTNKDVRILNRGLVLRQISVQSGISRVDIAGAARLTKTTISNVVNELIAQDLVEESSAQDHSASSGRPALGLSLSEKSPLICGILLKRKKTVLILGDLSGKTIDRVQYENLSLVDPMELMDQLCTAYLQLTCKYSRRVIGIGISSMGLVDSTNGLILNPPQYFTYDCDLPIIDSFRKRIPREKLPARIVLMHDTCASVLAEQTYSRLGAERSFAYLSLVDGIGLGMMLNGVDYEGVNGQSGELGHTTVNSDGPRCECGNRGCLELYASIDALVSQLREFSTTFPAHPLMNRQHIMFADFVSLADQNDPLCTVLLKKYADWVSIALVNVVNILDIDLIVLEYQGQDGKPGIQPFLETYLEQKINRGILPKKTKKVRVERSRFGSNLSLIGSLSIIASEVFTGDLAL